MSGLTDQEMKDRRRRARELALEIGQLSARMAVLDNNAARAAAVSDDAGMCDAADELLELAVTFAERYRTYLSVRLSEPREAGPVGVVTRLPMPPGESMST